MNYRDTGVSKNISKRSINFYKIKACKRFRPGVSKMQETKDNHLEIKFEDRNQVDDNIAWVLGGEFLNFSFQFCKLMFSFFPQNILFL